MFQHDEPRASPFLLLNLFPSIYGAGHWLWDPCVLRTQHISTFRITFLCYSRHQHPHPLKLYPGIPVEFLSKMSKSIVLLKSFSHVALLITARRTVLFTCLISIVFKLSNHLLIFNFEYVSSIKDYGWCLLPFYSLNLPINSITTWARGPSIPLTILCCTTDTSITKPLVPLKYNTGQLMK